MTEPTHFSFFGAARLLFSCFCVLFASAPYYWLAVVGLVRQTEEPAGIAMLVSFFSMLMLIVVFGTSTAMLQPFSIFAPLHYRFKLIGQMIVEAGNGGLASASFLYSKALLGVHIFGYVWIYLTGFGFAVHSLTVSLCGVLFLYVAYVVCMIACLFAPLVRREVFV